MKEFTELEVREIKREQNLREIKGFKVISIRVIVYTSFVMILFSIIAVFIRGLQGGFI